MKAPEYDLDGAKKLMIEAGYAKGFDLDYLVYTPMVLLGEAVAGDHRPLGRKQGQSKLQA